MSETDVRGEEGYNPNQHCTNPDCMTFSHTAKYCGEPQPRRCPCSFDYPEDAVSVPTWDTTPMLRRYTALRSHAAACNGTDNQSPEAWQYAINKVKVMDPEQFPIPGDAYDIDNMPYGLSVHITHCCSRHGCKYGYSTGCAVMLGEFAQDNRCEQCDEQQERANKILQQVQRAAQEEFPTSVHDREVFMRGARWATKQEEF